MLFQIQIHYLMHHNKRCNPQPRSIGIYMSTSFGLIGVRFPQISQIYHLFSSIFSTGLDLLRSDPADDADYPPLTEAYLRDLRSQT